MEYGPFSLSGLILVIVAMQYKYMYNNSKPAQHWFVARKKRLTETQMQKWMEEKKCTVFKAYILGH